MSKVDIYLERREMSEFSGSVKKLVLREDINLGRALDLVLSK